MICWSCERSAGEGSHCARCGAILPPDAKQDYFAVMGVERRYDVELAQLERRYREQSRAVHPDRFATADARARRASLQRSVQLNEAWRTLKDPVRRAEYLLSLAGVTLAKEVPPALLMETLELREELGEARAAGDDRKVQAMAGTMRARVAAALKAVSEGLAADDYPRVATELVALRYYRRFMDEVSLHDDARDSAADGSAGAGADMRGA